jgi:hypothetical protein
MQIPQRSTAMPSNASFSLTRPSLVVRRRWTSMPPVKSTEVFAEGCQDVDTESEAALLARVGAAGPMKSETIQRS